jgi:hypothetical protein
MNGMTTKKEKTTTKPRLYENMKEKSNLAKQVKDAGTVAKI